MNIAFLPINNINKPILSRNRFAMKSFLPDLMTSHLIWSRNFFCILANSIQLHFHSASLLLTFQSICTLSLSSTVLCLCLSANLQPVIIILIIPALLCKMQFRSRFRPPYCWLIDRSVCWFVMFQMNVCCLWKWVQRLNTSDKKSSQMGEDISYEEHVQQNNSRLVSIRQVSQFTYFVLLRRSLRSQKMLFWFIRSQIMIRKVHLSTFYNSEIMLTKKNSKTE